ncbi:MAG: glycosyltransferase family 9 protein [Lachnospiraceae bacterium]|jgi:ADP-heptose:LPS heptosyltransferase|nr:glycosyltransferase family 9 protein [Lachnospiraceae bacterium]
MNIQKQINRICIAFDAFMRSKNKNYPNGKIASKTILIVFQQIFGDAIVIENSLVEYTKLFPKAQGYKIIFLANPSVIDFMKATIFIPPDILMEAVDFKKFLDDFIYYKQIVKKYLNVSNILIVPGTSLSAEIFSSANNARRKIGLIRSIDVNKPFVMAIFSRIAYTEIVRPQKEDMMLQRHRLLIHYLGNKKYKAKLPKLLVKESVIPESHYCVLCPGASKMEKCWPTGRYAAIIDFIVDKYDMDVHLCGGSDELKFEKIIFSLVTHPKRVISHIGKTTFSEWSAIVQHADLVLGNDSATMHLAVASRRNAICIAGVYDKYQFFPYKVDTLEKNDKLPITIIKEMPCQWCRTIGYYAGFGNTECKNRIHANKCAACIDAITVNDVKEKIRQLMNIG